MLCHPSDVGVDHATCRINHKVVQPKDENRLNILKVGVNRQQDAAVGLKIIRHLLDGAPAKNKTNKSHDNHKRYDISKRFRKNA